jgi:RNA polymerase sigma-70 factor (ECF subfamily)
MEDQKIIELYEQRSEDAIAETRNKYGAYLKTIAYNILHNQEDSEECLQDTYMKTWNAIPPAKPNSLKSFIGRITRNAALDKYNKENAEKRGGGEIALVYEELSECLAAKVAGSPESEVELKELTALINDMLSDFSNDARNIFVLRYWYMYSDREIAERLGFTENKVRTSLSRTRAVLKDLLIEQGY